MGAIILGIAMFMFLVIIHELGHFSAAKKTGVHVLEFGIGIPPKVASLRKDKKGTHYSINFLPLGGFVRLKGEDPADESEFLAKDSFITASLSSKIIILIAGVTVNAVFAWLAFTFSFRYGVTPITIVPDSMMKQQSRSYLMPSESFLKEQGLLDQDAISQSNRVIIDQITTEGLGAEIGLMKGDEILAINQMRVTTSSMSQLLKDSIGKPIFFDVMRNGQRMRIEGLCGIDSCFLGVAMANNMIELPLIKKSLGGAMIAGFQEISAETKLTLGALKKLGLDLVSMNKERVSGSVDNLSGPVGIVVFGKKLFDEKGRIGYLSFAGMISLALAIFNILPIPALDGGRILSVLIQSISGLKPQKYFLIENYVNIVFFVILMGLGIYVIYQDILKI